MISLRRSSTFIGGAPLLILASGGADTRGSAPGRRGELSSMTGCDRTRGRNATPATAARGLTGEDDDGGGAVAILLEDDGSSAGMLPDDSESSRRSICLV